MFGGAGPAYLTSFPRFWAVAARRISSRAPDRPLGGAGRAWQQTSMFTSAIRQARGNAVPMRTPMACLDSTSPEEPTCQCILRLIFIRWRGSETNGHAKRWRLKRRQKDLTPVLHRPIEAALQKKRTFRRSCHFSTVSWALCELPY